MSYNLNVDQATKGIVTNGAETVTALSFVYDSNSNNRLLAKVMAIDTGSFKMSTQELLVCVQRGSGSCVLAGKTQTVPVAGDSAMLAASADILANGSGVDIKVTGLEGLQIQWVVQLYTDKVTNIVAGV